MNYTQWRDMRFPQVQEGANVLNPEGMAEEPVVIELVDCQEAVVALAEVRGYMLRHNSGTDRDFVIPRVDIALKAFRVDEAIKQMSQEANHWT